MLINAKRSFKLILYVVLIFSFLLRVIDLHNLPPSLNWDEVSHGYNAYSILKTGEDEWGVRMPLIFKAYGDYKLPVYIYATVPAIAVFGLNEFSVRIVSALSGTLLVLYSYLVIYEFLRKKSIAIAAAILVSLSPWSLFLSRIALEANLALFLIVSGVYYFILGIRKKNWNLPLSICLFSFSIWTYNSARIFVPFLLISLFLIFRKELLKVTRERKKLFILSSIILAVFFLPMFVQLFQIQGNARYDAIKILDSGAIAQIVENRNTSALPDPLARLINNKLTYFFQQFIQNYISSFSPSFLFTNGGSHYQFSIPGRGLLYIINAPLFLLGLIVTLKSFKQKQNLIMLTWLILSPIAGSTTRDAPHTLRTFVMFPALVYFIVLGVYQISKLTKKKLFAVFIYSFALVVFFIYYFYDYTTSYAKEYSWAWQYGYKTIVNYVEKNYEKYDQIIVTKKYGEPHEFFLFFLKYDPAKYKTDSNLIRFNQSNWFWVDHFDKFWFVNDWQVKDLVTESKHKIDCSESKCLLITSPDNAPDGWDRIEIVNLLDNTPAFEIYENN